MTLQELLAQHAMRPATGVPDWMLGFYKRYAISFANGLTDLSTHVCWLQSRHFTIDLRLPLEADQVPAKPWLDYTATELQVLANHEGWKALSDWDGHVLSWRDPDASLQVHNRWPEPAILKRVGNCMIEFCASDAYVEDWRLQASKPGPLIGLHLVEERDLSTGEVRHRQGGLIVCGDHAGLVLGRAAEEAPTVSVPPSDVQLRNLVQQAQGDAAALAHWFNFETSVAHGSLAEGFAVTLSTQPGRVGQHLFPLDGFEAPTPNADNPWGQTHQVRQRLTIDGRPCERVFIIDTLEPLVSFDQATPCTPESQAWQEREAATLSRYTKPLT